MMICLNWINLYRQVLEVDIGKFTCFCHSMNQGHMASLAGAVMPSLDEFIGFLRYKPGYV